jgi:hypothetical protein
VEPAGGDAVTFHDQMTAGLRMAALSDLLPATTPARPGRWRARLPRLAWFTRRPGGLESVPERYRLQFLLLASDALPAGDPADIAVLAGRLAGRVTIPGRLLGDTPAMDAWFRDRTGRIQASLGELLEAEAR